MKKRNLKIAFFSSLPVLAAATTIAVKKIGKPKTGLPSTPSPHPDHEPDLFI